MKCLFMNEHQVREALENAQWLITHYEETLVLLQKVLTERMGILKKPQ